MKPIGRHDDYDPPCESFVAVYVDRMATPDAVRSAVAKVPLPAGVTRVAVDDSLFTETFDCRVVVYLTGEFDAAVGAALARDYATGLSRVLGCPAYSLNDLLRVGPATD